jgi:fatty acid desaturase
MNIDIWTLDKEVALSGLMKRNYLYYLFLAGLLFLWFSLSIFLITLWDNILIIVLNGIFLGFLRLQIGFIGHDLSHIQVFQGKNKNIFFASLIWGIFLWASASWWQDYHNSHHKNTNQLGSDPDLDIPFLFDSRQIKRAWIFTKKFIFPLQHIFFLPGLSLTYPYKFIQCIQWIKSNLNYKSIFETFLIVVSILSFLFFVFHYLSLFYGILFFVIHIIILSVYMGIAFLPNHFWETIIEKNDIYKRYYQIITSRNISWGKIIDFLLWGLNLQIEHHLYPTMPRPNLPKAGKMTKIYCKKAEIPYHEVGVLTSFKEILFSLKELTTNYKI